MVKVQGTDGAFYCLQTKKEYGWSFKLFKMLK